MLYPELRNLGAFVRWLLKGCKTKLKYEVFDNTDYDRENYLIGIVVVSIPVLIAIILICVGVIR